MRFLDLFVLFASNQSLASSISLSPVTQLSSLCEKEWGCCTSAEPRPSVVHLTRVATTPATTIVAPHLTNKLAKGGKADNVCFEISRTHPGSLKVKIGLKS